MADLARLVVRLEADSLKFQKELDAAKRRLSSFEKSSTKTANLIGGMLGKLAAGLTVGAFAKLSKDAINLADETSKAAAKIGVTTEALSQLRYVAELGGVANAKFDASLVKLNRNLTEAAMNAESRAAKAFQALGVSTTDANGNLRATDAVLEDVADRFQGMQDGAAKTAIAVDLLGRSGADLIPTLNGGSKSIQDLRKEADAFGQTVNGNAAKAAEQFNDNLSRLQKIVSGSFLQAMQQLTPTLANVSDELVRNAREANAAQKGASALVSGFRLLVSAGILLKGTFQTVGVAIGGLAAAVNQIDFKRVALQALGPVGTLVNALKKAEDGTTATGRAADTLGQTFSDIRSQMEADGRLIDAVWKDTADNIDAAAGASAAGARTVEGALIGLGESAKKSADAQAQALTTLQNMAQQLTQQTATFGMAEGAVIRYRIAHGDLAETLRQAGAEGQKYAATITEMTDKLVELEAVQKRTELAEQVYQDALSRGRQITESVQTPLEAYQDQIIELNALLQNGAITQETYGRAVKKAGEDFDEATNKAKVNLEEISKNLLQNVQSALADYLFDPFADGTKSMGEKFSEMLRRMAAEAASAAIMQHLFGMANGAPIEGAGGGLFGSLLGGLAGALGFRANGGPVMAGQPYIVGERGPELMIPSSSGDVVSNRDMGGMAGTTVNMTVVTPNADSFRRSERQVSHSLKRGLRE